jgi:hypothetical protein
MLKQVYDFARRLFTLAQETEHDKQEIKEVRQEVRQVSQELRGLTEVVQRLAFELQRVRENETLWDFSPRREQTALSLVGEALRDATSGNTESDLLDRNVLEAITAFRRVLDHGLDAITFDAGTEGETAVSVTLDGLRTAERIRQEAPPPETVIVSGELDELRGTRKAFGLRLPSGQNVPGLLPPGDPGAYGLLWTRKVVVDGEVHFRPSGAVSLIIARHIQEATPADAIWERIPRPRPRSVDEVKPAKQAPPGTNPMALIFGRWPGDETEEELLAALIGSKTRP